MSRPGRSCSSVPRRSRRTSPTSTASWACAGVRSSPTASLRTRSWPGRPRRPASADGAAAALQARPLLEPVRERDQAALRMGLLEADDGRRGDPQMPAARRRRARIGVLLAELAAQCEQDVDPLELAALEQRLGQGVELRALVLEQAQGVGVGVGHKPLHLLVDDTPRVLGQAHVLAALAMTDDLSDAL